MRKIWRRIRRIFRLTIATLAITGVVFLFYVVSLIPVHVIYWCGAVAAMLFLIRLISKLGSAASKYTNEQGYVVLTAQNELEHRYIARQYLSRDLKRNEIVHHINGKRADNSIGNLCVMDRYKHEHFHSWLSWKRKKDGRYPSFSSQKKALTHEYGGILLENFSPQFKRLHAPPGAIIDSANIQIADDENASEILFEYLRKERKRLADERSAPAYVIIRDKPLRAIARNMPDTLDEMSRVEGVTQTKLRMYGMHFLNVIRRFKSELGIKPKDSA